MAARGSTVLTLYRATADRFAQEIRASVGDAVEAVVLYGSVARRRARRESDIDILVLTDAGHDVESKLIEIGERLDYENGFDSFVMPLHLSGDRLLSLAHMGFPIARHILAEGVVLYDNGTFARIRGNTPAPGG